MSEIYLLSDIRETFNIINISCDVNSIYPRLIFNIEINQFSKNSDNRVIFTNILGKLYAIKKGGVNIFIGNLFSESPSLTIKGSTRNASTFYFMTDYFGLAQIEELRENGDLNLRCDIGFMYKIEQPLPVESTEKVQIDYKIPKSDWVEKLLKEFRYKQVFLLEIPRLSNGEYVKVIEYLEMSWKNLAMGEYSDVLGKCQKALEEIKDIAKIRGFVNDDKEIDFSRLLESEPAGKCLSEIFRNIWGFLQPGGRHIGRNVGKEDAEFVMLTVYGIINLVVRKFSKEKMNTP